MGRHRVTAAAVAVLVVVVLTGGCSGPSVDTSACTTTRDELIATLATRLHQGALRHGRQVAGARDGVVFVSAERYDPADDGDDGDIYTWAITRNDEVLAVDTRAKSESSWPRADFDVREDGALESRACTDEARERKDDSGCAEGTPEQFCDRTR